MSSREKYLPSWAMLVIENVFAQLATCRSVCRQVWRNWLQVDSRNLTRPKHRELFGRLEKQRVGSDVDKFDVRADSGSEVAA